MVDDLAYTFDPASVRIVDKQGESAIPETDWPSLANQPPLDLRIRGVKF